MWCGGVLFPTVTAAYLDKVHQVIVAVLQEIHTELSQEESNI